MTPLVAWRALLALSCGGCAAGFLFTFRPALVRQFRVRSSRLRAQLLFLELADVSRWMLIGQAALLGSSLLLLSLRAFLAATLALVLALSPNPWLELKRARRVALLDAAVPAWLASLAGTLRATPALGEALAYSSSLVTGPLRHELLRCVLEQRLGASLAAALDALARRVDSRTLRSAVAVLRLGARSGGDLSRILEEAAASLRELARLEGVLRTRTAEGRAQAFVVAVIPFPTVALLAYLDPEFLRPLWTAPRGPLVIAGSACLWLLSLVAARRILRVDL